MEQIRNIFKQYLHAYMHHQWDGIKDWFDRDTAIEYSTAGSARGYDAITKILRIPDVTFHVLTTTITNTITKSESQYTTLWCIVHHLHGMEVNNALFPLLYGGKYQFVCDFEKQKICSVRFDLEYEYGNTILAAKCWDLYEKTRLKRIIKNDGLYQMERESADIKTVVYKILWALDTLDQELFIQYSTNDVKIIRAGVDGDSYCLFNHKQLSGFMEQDKQYFDQNQYSVSIKEIKEVSNQRTSVTAFHLSPGKPGNKHLGFDTKYTQFYNEIIEMEFLQAEYSWKLTGMTITRKEIPITYGYESIEL